MANSTAGTIAEYIWKILRTSGSSTDVEALQESFVLTMISQAQAEYKRAFRRGGTEPVTSLLEGGFDLIADTKVNEASGIVTTDTEFTVDDSDDFDTSSGALAIWKGQTGDVTYYTTNTVATETFSGVTGLGMSHDDNETVQKLYKLPTNFKTFRAADGWGDGVRLNGAGLRFREAAPEAGYFTTRDNGTNKFLWLPLGTTGDAEYLFESTGTTIDSSDDIVDVPPEHEFFLVWRPVQTLTVPKEGGPSELYMLAKGEANKILGEALKDKNIGQHVRVRQFSIPGHIPRDPSLYQRVPR